MIGVDSQKVQVTPSGQRSARCDCAGRFRCARAFGYGASPGMVRRSLERVDDERLPGTFRLLRALSDTKPVYTQGPVWYVGGKAV